MQNILIIAHASPYGSERCLSALRVALALAREQDKAKVTLFLMSDATVVGLPNQQDAGQTLQTMVEELVALKVPVHLCRTCALARGLGELKLIDGCDIRTLADLAAATLAADKVITF